jgi:hypothetical protein
MQLMIALTKYPDFCTYSFKNGYHFNYNPLLTLDPQTEIYPWEALAFRKKVKTIITISHVDDFIFGVNESSILTNLNPT